MYINIYIFYSISSKKNKRRIEKINIGYKREMQQNKTGWTCSKIGRKAHDMTEETRLETVLRTTETMLIGESERLLEKIMQNREK